MGSNFPNFVLINQPSIKHKLVICPNHNYNIGTLYQLL